MRCAGSVAVASAIPKSAAARTASAPIGSGSGFVHLQGAAGNFLPIQSGYGLGRFRVIGDFDKRKASRLTRLTVLHDVNTRDLSERLKEHAEIAFRSLKTHVADKQILHRSLLSKPQVRKISLPGRREALPNARGGAA